MSFKFETQKKLLIKMTSRILRQTIFSCFLEVRQPTVLSRFLVVCHLTNRFLVVRQPNISLSSSAST